MSDPCWNYREMATSEASTRGNWVNCRVESSSSGCSGPHAGGICWQAADAPRGLSGDLKGNLGEFVILRPWNPASYWIDLVVMRSWPCFSSSVDAETALYNELWHHWCWTSRYCSPQRRSRLLLPSRTHRAGIASLHMVNLSSVEISTSLCLQLLQFPHLFAFLMGLPLLFRLWFYC